MEWSTGIKGANAMTALADIICQVEGEKWPEARHPSFPHLKNTVTPTIFQGGSYESVMHQQCYL